MKTIILLSVISFLIGESASPCAAGSGKKLSHQQQREMERLLKKVVAMRAKQQRAVASDQETTK